MKSLSLKYIYNYLKCFQHQNQSKNLILPNQNLIVYLLIYYTFFTEKFYNEKITAMT